MTKYLIFGNGYLGNKFHDYFISEREKSILLEEKICNTTIEKDIKYLIKEYQPEVVINCIGKVGRPNADWCESHKVDTFFSNVTVPTFMAEICESENIYMVHMGSGCIYDTYPEFPNPNLYNDIYQYKEDDNPNFKGLWYSKTKIYCEQILKRYNNVLQLRLRMPFDNKSSRRNLITKLIGYREVLGDEKNSITYIPDLMEVSKILINRKKTGIYNVVNKGGITHREILQMYKEIVDPNFHMPIFITKDKLKEIVVDRTNCILSTQKLESEGIDIRNVKDAVKICLENYH